MSIIDDIINKFPSIFDYYAYTASVGDPRVVEESRRRTYIHVYDTDRSFRNHIRKTTCHIKSQPPTIHAIEFWLITPAMKIFLTKKLREQNVELMYFAGDKFGSLKVRDTEQALNIAENVEEFIEMLNTDMQAINEITQKVLAKLLEQYSVGYYSKGFAPSSRGGWSMIRQQPHEHPREAGFPYRNWNEEDDEEKNEVDDVSVASGMINKLNPNRVSQSKMSDPGDNYGKMRSLQVRQQAKSSIHGGVGIEVDDETDADEDNDELDETTAANYSMFSRQPGHHGAGLQQQPSRNSGAYMQGAAVAHAGQGQRGWASGIKNDDAYEDEPEETDSPIKKFIKHSIKKTLADNTIKPIYGKDTTGSSNRLGGYHGTNSWAKGITQLKNSGTNSSSDDDKLKLKDFIYSDALEDRYDIDDKKGK